MLRICILVYIVSIFIIGFWCEGDFLQERAKLRYANPKYIKDVVVFTGRMSRRDPYLTNLTATVLVPYGNNVTFQLTLIMATGGDFKIVTKLCDCMKHKWMMEYARSYTNLSIDKCPISPGRYIYKNMELPPKNIPLPIADGDYWIRYELYVTATKETIIDARTLLRYDNNKKISKKTKKG